MNINNLEIYQFLIKILNNKPKKINSTKMLIDLIETQIDKDEENFEIPVRVSRKLLYSNATGEVIESVQEKTVQNYKAKNLQQELDKTIDEQQVSRDFFSNLGIRPVICENATEGNQAKEFWIELQRIDNSFNQEVKSNSVIDDAIFELAQSHVPVNKLDIVYERTKFDEIKISRSAKFFFNKDGELIVRKPKGIAFMLYLMAGYIFNWIILFSSVLLFILYVYSKSVWLIYLSFIYIVVLTLFSFSAHKNKYKRLNSLVQRRIIKAPEFLLHIDQYNADLELNRPTDFNIAKITEYYSTCPICQSRILVDYGDETYKYYMVGRCRNAPDAHVYSFDRVTLKGFFLGHEGYLK